MSTDSMQDIIKRIRTRRKEENYSFQHLADLTNMSKSTLQRYESGAIKNIPLDKLKILATALNTTPEWIMGWEETNSKTNNICTINKTLNKDEASIINNYRNLNAEGQERLLETSNEMTQLSKYKKVLPLNNEQEDDDEYISLKLVGRDGSRVNRMVNKKETLAILKELENVEECDDL